uniref:Uncharacterized protein n=1 Tax=Pipistrellus kuhlii TaxID=59472 RepID=A0A7J7VBC1_PIPKU|nr:hypothetical protein mPipKuh1_008478 [Pipistrellus kuhlii]
MEVCPSLPSGRCPGAAVEDAGCSGWGGREEGMCHPPLRWGPVLSLGLWVFRVCASVRPCKYVVEGKQRPCPVSAAPTLLRTPLLRPSPHSGQAALPGGCRPQVTPHRAAAGFPRAAAGGPPSSLDSCPCPRCHRPGPPGPQPSPSPLLPGPQPTPSRSRADAGSGIRAALKRSQPTFTKKSFWALRCPSPLVQCSGCWGGQSEGVGGGWRGQMCLEGPLRAHG